ncbi:MAG: DnaA/Hda family protein [bacterium]
MPVRADEQPRQGAGTLHGVTGTAAGQSPDSPARVSLPAIEPDSAAKTIGQTGKCGGADAGPPEAGHPRQPPAEKPVPEKSKAELYPKPQRKTGSRWSLELPLVPTCSFETLVVGPHNRFAHAASMAVVENPGTMYNPLLLFGNPGTGKTHFLHSIGYGLSSVLGQDNLLITDGVKLSRSVQLAAKKWGVAELEAVFEKAKALIVDDIHLMVLEDENKKYLSKRFNDFMAQGRQVVLTSVFPPKALASLENSLGFQLSQGWMVDLKVPSSQSYKVILNQMLHGLDVDLNENETATIFCSNQMPLGDVAGTLRNLKRLERLPAIKDKQLANAALLDMLLGFSEQACEPALSKEELQAAEAALSVAGGKSGRWGIFYPRGSEKTAGWVLHSAAERAAELGMKTGWKEVFKKEYGQDELYGVPFKIAEYSDTAKAAGVIVVGPHPSSGLGAQEAEFRQVTAKFLESMLIKCGWIGHSQIKSQSAYTRLLMDLL